MVKEGWKRGVHELGGCEVLVAIFMVRHPALKRRSDVDQGPRVLCFLGRYLKVWNVQPQAPFLLRGVDRHPDALGRRKVLLPGQRDRSLVCLQEARYVAHVISPSKGRS